MKIICLQQFFSPLHEILFICFFGHHIFIREFYGYHIFLRKIMFFWVIKFLCEVYVFMLFLYFCFHEKLIQNEYNTLKICYLTRLSTAYLQPLSPIFVGKTKWSVHTYIIFKIFKWKITFLKMNDFYGENQKYTEKTTWFLCTDGWRKCEVFLRFQCGKKSLQKFFRRIFMFFAIKAAIFIFLENIFQFWAQILKEHTRT